MEKFLFFCTVIFGIILSCNKPNVPEKYYVEIKQNYWTDLGGDNYDIKTEEIIANNFEEAYLKGYNMYIANKKASLGSRLNLAQKMIIGFRVLDQDKKDISHEVSHKFRYCPHCRRSASGIYQRRLKTK